MPSAAVSRRRSALAQADLVVTSTRQEAENQYARYGNVHADCVEVVPPGVDVSRFHSGGSAQERIDVVAMLG